MLIWTRYTRFFALFILFLGLGLWLGLGQSAPVEAETAVSHLDHNHSIPASRILGQLGGVGRQTVAQTHCPALHAGAHRLL